MKTDPATLALLLVAALLLGWRGALGIALGLYLDVVVSFIKGQIARLTQ